MSNSIEQKQETRTGRIQVGNLPQEEKSVKDQEAENVKGGGGLSGGVIASEIEEEIPKN